MTELTDLNDTDALNTAVTGNSTEGNVANMGNMDNLQQAILGMLSRFRNANVFRLRDNTDNTKKLAFNLSGITSGQERTLTAPDANGTVMLTSTGLATSQVITGGIVKSGYGSYTNNTDLTANIPFDDTAPRWDEGVAIITVQITPASASNKIRCRFYTEASVSVLGVAVAALYVNPGSAAATASRTVYTTIPNAGYGGVLAMEYEYTPGSTTLQDISIRVGSNTGTLRLNGNTTARVFGGTLAATLVVEEIKA